MRIFQLLIFIMCTVLLSSCATISDKTAKYDHGRDYTHMERYQGKRLVMPTGLSNHKIEDFYLVPKVKVAKSNANPPSLTPPKQQTTGG